MILETVRMVTTALQHPTYGVNAQLVTLPLMAGDTTPPALVTITDETANGPVARNFLPTALPAAAVAAYQPATMDGEFSNGQRDGTVSIVIRLALLNSASEKGLVAIYYLTRAVERALRDLMDDEAARLLNGIQLIGFEPAQTMTTLTAQVPKEDGPITGGLILSLHVRDTQP